MGEELLSDLGPVSCWLSLELHAGGVRPAEDDIGRQADFQPLYQAIVRTAVQAIKADELATFLGRKLTSAFTGEAGNDFHTRIQGTRIRLI